MPYFSIIIPVYNVAPYLRECLDSVLAQSFSDWEAICVDDGSTDESGAILDEYAAKDKRFRVIHQVNAGVSAARNKALENFDGDWICFLDGDDKISSEWLSFAKRSLDIHNPDILRMRLRFWYKGYNSKLKENRFDSNYVVSGKSAVCEWGWKTLLEGGWIWLLFIHKTMLYAKDCRFPVGIKLREDMVFFARLMMNVNKVVQSSFDGYWYRMRKSSACHTVRQRKECLLFFEEMISIYQNQECLIKFCRAPLEIKRGLGRSLWHVFVEWLDYNSQDESSTNMQKFLIELFDCGILDYKCISGRWVVPVCFFRVTKSLSLIHLSACIFRFIRKIKYLFKKRDRYESFFH